MSHSGHLQTTYKNTIYHHADGRDEATIEFRAKKDATKRESYVTVNEGFVQINEIVLIS